MATGTLISHLDFLNFCRALFLTCISQYNAVFRLILPNPFLPVCSSTDSDSTESFLSLLLFQTKHLLGGVFCLFSNQRKYLSLFKSLRSFTLMNDDHKGGLQTVLVLLQCQDECHVSLKSIKVTLHIQESIRE